MSVKKAIKRRIRKPLKLDDHGYISGRGLSKYWGVTKGPDAGGKDRWVVSFQTMGAVLHGQDECVKFKLDWINPSEQDAARVARYIYDKGQNLNAIKTSDGIPSADGKYIMKIRVYDHSVFREKKEEISNSLPFIHVGEMVEEKNNQTVEEVKGEIVLHSASEIFDFKFRMLVEHVSQVELSAEQADILIAYIQRRIKK
jgi:hypothetical protein